MVWRVIQIIARVLLGILVAFVLFEVGAWLGDLTHTGPLPLIVIAAAVVFIAITTRRKKETAEPAEPAEPSAPSDPQDL